MTQLYKVWAIFHNSSKFGDIKLSWKSDIPCCYKCIEEIKNKYPGTIDDTCCCTHANQLKEVLLKIKDIIKDRRKKLQYGGNYN